MKLVFGYGFSPLLHCFRTKEIMITNNNPEEIIDMAFMLFNQIEVFTDTVASLRKLLGIVF